MSGVGAYETTIGIQSAGVIACAKHYIGNERECRWHDLYATTPDRLRRFLQRNTSAADLAQSLPAPTLTTA